MNYKREGSIYGIVFYDMASEENIPDFPQVKYHVDFCIIHNRLYNGYYTHPSEFWKDLGFIFKNCRVSYPNRMSTARVAGDILR